MKKFYAALAALLAALLLLSACGAGTQEGTEPSSDGEAETTSTGEAEPVLTQLPRYGGWGDGAVVHLDSAAVTALRESEAARVGAVYPVFVNDYPTDQGGPIYEITEALTAREEANLLRFLTLLYGEGDYELEHPDYSPDSVIYEHGDASFNSHPNSIAALLDASFLGKPAPSELLQNTAVKAALAYVGIETPRVEESTTFKIDGSVMDYCYRITETYADNNDQMLYDSFRYVTAEYAPQEGRLGIRAADIDPLELEQEREAAMPARAAVDSLLTQLFPDAPPEEYYIDVSYTRVSDREAGVGYFIPQYSVYIKEESVSEELRTSVYSVANLTIENLLSLTDAGEE